MKLTRFLNLLVIGLLLGLFATGCRKSPYNNRPIPGQSWEGPTEPNATNMIGAPTLVPVDTNTLSTLIPPTRNERVGWTHHPEVFAEFTVYFDYDSSTLKSAERSKVASVADYLKANPTEAVEVQGHCDERGTEEYNRSLGERRALAVREQLVTLGIDPGRVDTISYGEDRPADSRHEEGAWKKNRRADFILLKPPQ